MHKLSTWSLTLLQIRFLTFKASHRNKQCSVMMKTQMVSLNCKRMKVRRYICYDIRAVNLKSSSYISDIVVEFPKILAILVLVS